MKVFSKVDHGSTFQVFWPVVEKENSNDFSEKKKPCLFKGTGQIMLVDDEEDVLKTTKAILERQGYKVKSFEDGLSAIETFTKNPDFFDLIITDMTMPHMTGNELSVQILKLRKDMPIILCTGFSEIMSGEQAALIGIKGFLMKPATAADLFNKIHEVLGNEKKFIS